MTIQISGFYDDEDDYEDYGDFGSNCENATIFSKCHHCQNTIIIANSWTPGGCNDYGGFIDKCVNCSAVLDIHVGRDINMSSIVSGATKLGTYDDEIPNQHANVRERFGLSALLDTKK